MKTEQLYRKLEEGEIIGCTDLIWMEEEQWATVDEMHVGKRLEGNTAALRPVEVQQSPDHEIAYLEANVSPDSMTKRERFAMAAMQGLCSTTSLDECFSAKAVAETAVEQADALIAALNAKEAP